MAGSNFSDIQDKFFEINQIDDAFFNDYDIKRGLRNADGTGVVAGVTNISNVHGYVISDEEKVPDDGKLTLRGYDLYDLLGTDATSAPRTEVIEGVSKRYRYEELAYLLINGDLPTQDKLDEFISTIDANRELPEGFTASMIMMDTPPDIMNVLARSVLLLYGYDNDAENRSFEHEVAVATSLLARLPRIMVLTYYAKRARFYNESMIMHRFIPGQSTAETILSMLRPDRSFTPEEARMLDIMMCLHAEHGGGNNSTFVTRTLTSANTDAYSTYAGAIGALKGRRHGGANHSVRAMHADIKKNVVNWENEDEIAAYLEKIIRREAFDKTGLVYGMGHAVYTKSDPRAIVCKKFAEGLALGTEFEEEYRLLERVERLTPEVLSNTRGIEKTMCANVDMYSGFVYSMMGIPEDLYTPLFACSRMAGWIAHRFEEIVSGKRIMRPAYKTTFSKPREYKPIDER